MFEMPSFVAARERNGAKELFILFKHPLMIPIAFEHFKA
ncbi:hypothetical protein NIES2104_25520 [Leptolyngbya sp. NIES-2104]|nr:hypothetical protein NIES2104_25520 [Leptolyngbya sp. NIES-2104]